MNKSNLEKIYFKESKKMIHFIRKLINNKIDIYDEMDILQETFYSLINGINGTETIDNLTAYIYTSIRNRIIDLFRKKKLNYDTQVELEELAIDDIVIDQIEQQEMIEFIYAALDKLPDKQKQVFIKTEIDEMTYQQISNETGVSINTLLAQKKYAINKLKEKLNALQK
jgi:RNA polymerase sigma factor (sigma-70 family)